MESSLDLSLSHGDLLDVSCDKDELCATTSVLHASAENKHVMHVASKNDGCLLYIPWVTLNLIICVINIV
jgi:hypothetical protein